MTETVIARRYANALFSLSKKQGVTELDDHGKCLDELANAIKATPTLSVLLKSPVIDVKEKKLFWALFWKNCQQLMQPCAISAFYWQIKTAWVYF